jgi:cysteinyl-tRNA synthetase
MHNGWVTMAGEKMSKSLGNTVSISEMARQWRPVELRYYLGAAHYRSAIEYSPEALKEAAVAYAKLENFVQRAMELVGEADRAVELPASFVEAMDDDLGVPQALAIIHNTRRDGNIGLHRSDKDVVRTTLGLVLAMTGVLGLNPLDWQAAGAAQKSGSNQAALTATVDRLVRLALQQRQDARARKDYAAGDAIRDALGEAGVQVEDTPDGPRWTLAPSRIGSDDDGR